ncbi:MAG: DivIVA domain-containing protein [Deltaproteobacteria bacterium]|nr:DivIVA domain-containing protein [Deltaproteobacteria bacterium]
MRVTALEISSHRFNKALRGYDKKEVDALKDLAAEALADAAREISELEGKLKESARQLAEHVERENMLKGTITTAHKMVEDLKNNAVKEAELIVAEARVRADEIIRDAHKRATALQDDIYRLKRQRIELETAMKAIIEYHSSTLFLEEEPEKPDDTPEITPLPPEEE